MTTPTIPHAKPVRRIAMVLVLLPALLSVSCMLRGPGQLRRELSSAAGVELDRQMGLTLGRTSTWLARKILKWSGETEVSLRGLRKVQVGIYEVRGLRPGRDARHQLSLTDLPDWTPLVQIHEDESDVFVLTREDEFHIRKMLVVVAEDDEWIIVKLHGKLDQILEDAMQMAFDEADRPELYAASRRERGLEPVDVVEDSDPQLPQDGETQADGDDVGDTGDTDDG